MSELSVGQKLSKELFYEKRIFFLTASQKEIEQCFSFAEDYKSFLNKSKTEREACQTAVQIAKNNGFKEFHFGDKLKVGDKRFFVNRDKSVVVFKIGKNNLEDKGIKILGAHIDSPRIDLKQNPIYEQDGFCLFKTHYYGGIKKYQWTTTPLALHGVVVLKDGKRVDVSVGEDENDPIFYITDLLPHLGAKQMALNGENIITGEQLNVIVGGMPFNDDKVPNKIKLNILKILNDKYGICEEDFLSSELSVVPAFKAKDIGLDRVFIGAYGHDDKSCAYPALMATINSKSDDTTMALLVDKEEVGSEGNTGMKSKVYEDLIDEIAISFNCNIRKVRANSRCLSADVTSCYDPTFANSFDATIFEKSNSAIISCGACINKFTGARGKSGANDASCELVGEIRKAFLKDNVVWQTAELGAVDIGGGGTIAKFVASLNIDTIDIGVPVISMHAPYELISKGDLYSTYKAFSAFLK